MSYLCWSILPLLFLVQTGTDAAAERMVLEGKWIAIAFEEDGKKAGKRLLDSISCTFEGDQFTWWAEGTVQLDGTNTLDPSKKPKQIDIVDRKRKFEGAGIYELEGDVLKIRIHEAQKAPRPTAFTTEKGTRDHWLLILKRMK